MQVGKYLFEFFLQKVALGKTKRILTVGIEFLPWKNQSSEVYIPVIIWNEKKRRKKGKGKVEKEGKKNKERVWKNKDL